MSCQHLTHVNISKLTSVNITCQHPLMSTSPHINMASHSHQLRLTSTSFYVNIISHPLVAPTSNQHGCMRIFKSRNLNHKISTIIMLPLMATSTQVLTVECTPVSRIARDLPRDTRPTLYKRLNY